MSLGLLSGCTQSSGSESFGLLAAVLLAVALVIFLVSQLLIAFPRHSLFVAALACGAISIQAILGESRKNNRSALQKVLLYLAGLLLLYELLILLSIVFG
ncbi:hypothetical protein [Thauera sp. Sel9]|uniref:hypothetical protein n=1 Tax=Thauera sp. Sel9 TaxID=2974299 RepID=UPI0021E17210|nr:hypothetical protein [Thauera sp. Sel9]MCV2217266.1 hypothetical protein [Thauera sp. Sel9]